MPLAIDELITAYLALWPDLAHSIATAKFGGGLVWDVERQMCVPDDEVLMFEVKREVEHGTVPGMGSAASGGKNLAADTQHVSAVRQTGA